MQARWLLSAGHGGANGMSPVIPPHTTVRTRSEMQGESAGMSFSSAKQGRKGKRIPQKVKQRNSSSPEVPRKHHLIHPLVTTSTAKNTLAAMTIMSSSSQLKKQHTCMNGSTISEKKKMLVWRQNRNQEDHAQQHVHALPNPIK